MFERFHRGHDPNFSNVPGTGLGLYIVRQVADRHRGRIVIERSEPGAGTVFGALSSAGPARNPSRCRSELVAASRAVPEPSVIRRPVGPGYGGVTAWPLIGRGFVRRLPMTRL